MDASSGNPTDTQNVPTVSFKLSKPTDASEGYTIDSSWISDGGEGNAYTKYLQNVLSRTKGYRMLGQILYRPVVGVLVLAWSFVLWRKHRSTETAVTWRDAVALAMVVACVSSRNMIAAIGLTAAYAAWSTLADRSWNSTGKLPSFDTFLASLQASKLSPPKPVAPASPDSEAAHLAHFEAKLGLPEKNPDSDCVVCWSSEESPLQLPCSHLVCSDCLARLKEAHRFLCPFCRRPLYSLQTTKIYLFQLSVASAGAQLALAILLAALRINRQQYFGATLSLLMSAWPAWGMLRSHSQIRTQGEEGYFASTSEGTLVFHLLLACYMIYSGFQSIQMVDIATFVDGRFVRARWNEWQVAKELWCAVAPGIIGRVVSYQDVVSG